MKKVLFLILILFLISSSCNLFGPKKESYKFQIQGTITRLQDNTPVNNVIVELKIREGQGGTAVSLATNETGIYHIESALFKDIECKKEDLKLYATWLGIDPGSHDDRLVATIKQQR